MGIAMFGGAVAGTTPLAIILAIIGGLRVWERIRAARPSGERGGAVDWTRPGVLPEVLFDLELKDLPKVGVRKVERLRRCGPSRAGARRWGQLGAGAPSS